MTVKPKKATAVDRVQRSRLNPKEVQRELMGDDIDLDALLVYLKGQIKFEAVDLVTDVTVNRTVEGASTVKVSILDANRDLLRSGNLNSKLDIQLGGDPGIWFRLVQVEKQDDNLDLTFEDREIAILRTYKSLKLVHRSKATRAEFIRNLIREVKEETIPVVIPELHKVEPIQKSTQLAQWTDPTSATTVQKEGGIPEDYSGAQESHRHNEAQTNTTGAILARSLTVKNQPIDREQIRVSNTAISVAISMGCRRKIVVAMIMGGIQESSLRNLPYGDRDSLGFLQQRTSQGWGTPAEEMDVATAARMFLDRAIKADAVDPTRPYWDLVQAVQRSANGLLYNQWRAEAEQIVTAYGLPGGDLESSASSVNNMGDTSQEGANYIFYRGLPQSGGKSWKKEDSWACIQRLASEVGWRAFFVSGVFYYIAEDTLFKSAPIATVEEYTEGIEGIDGDYDIGKVAAECTITARVGTWLVPPGAVVVLQNMGPWNGRWIVNNFSRSLFDSKATITLKRPQPRLPEPLQNDFNQIPTWAATTDPAPVDNTYGRTTGYLNPLPTPMGNTSEFSMPDAEGAPDRLGVRHHAGKDWFAPGGTTVVAPIDGTIVEVRQSTGSSGQIFGGAVKLQQDNGYIWVFRHVQPIGALKVGSHVQQGAALAGVVRWADNPNSSHCHIEIWRTLEGGYVYENMIDPVKFIRGEAS
jgi:murein DD-endopeptidase MepM/ murein hydrolase activator NlpD